MQKRVAPASLASRALASTSSTSSSVSRLSPVGLGVMRRLRAVSAVLGAGAGLDREQACELHGGGWREVKDGEAFDRVLVMVKGVCQLGMEACVTLGMLTHAQADRSPRLVSPHTITISTRRRNYPARSSPRTPIRSGWIRWRACGAPASTSAAAALSAWAKASRIGRGCSQTLANLDPHPESVPINALVSVPGTPLEETPPVDPFDLVRMVATARIMMPLSRVRLSAGRQALTKEAQILCFLAGANSIFYGDKLLTTANNDVADDLALIEQAGLTVEPPSPSC